MHSLVSVARDYFKKQPYLFSPQKKVKKGGKCRPLSPRDTICHFMFFFEEKARNWWHHSFFQNVVALEEKLTKIQIWPRRGKLVWLKKKLWKKAVKKGGLRQWNSAISKALMTDEVKVGDAKWLTISAQLHVPGTYLVRRRPDMSKYAKIPDMQKIFSGPQWTADHTKWKSDGHRFSTKKG